MTESDLTIFHNPKCSKSREALELVRSRQVPYTVVEYLKAPPVRATLESMVAGLDGSPAELVRTGDAGFAELGVDASSLSSAPAVVDLLVAHPELMQRPVVVQGVRVVIGRPIERVAEALDHPPA